jgi:hypothetical protein
VFPSCNAFSSQDKENDMQTSLNVGRFTMAALALVAAASAAAAQPSRLKAPDVPPELEVPQDQKLFLAGHAEGTQNYMCLPSGGSIVWRPIGPQATLFRVVKGDPKQQLTTHFLSVNPADATARPTWQHSRDSSRVWGRVSASSTDPAYVEPDAIPWLLLEAAGTATGPTGGSELAETTFIQRVHTAGGLPPATGCGLTSQIGAMVMMPYTTDYFFYRPEH